MNPSLTLSDPLTTGLDGQPLNLWLQGEGNNWADPIPPMPPTAASQPPFFVSYPPFTNQTEPGVASDDNDPLPLTNKSNEPLNITLNSKRNLPEIPCLPSLEICNVQQCSAPTAATAVNAYPPLEQQHIVPVEGNGFVHRSDLSTVHAQQLQYYRNNLLYEANGKVANWKIPEDQQVSAGKSEDAEDILKRRVIIKEPNMTEPLRRKRPRSGCLEEKGREDLDTALRFLDHHEQDHQNSSKPAYISQGVTNCGQFSYETLIVFRPVMCSVCDKPFPLQEDLDYHIGKEHTKKIKRTPPKQEQEKEYICSECNIVLGNATNLRRHRNIVHSGKITDTCGTCGASFTSRHGYVMHMRDVHDAHQKASKKRKRSPTQGSSGWRVHRCLACPYWGTNKGNTARHIRIAHLKIREYECDICNEKFKTKNNMQVHRSSMHPEVYEDAMDPLIAENGALAP